MIVSHQNSIGILAIVLFVCVAQANANEKVRFDRQSQLLSLKVDSPIQIEKLQGQTVAELRDVFVVHLADAMPNSPSILGKVSFDVETKELRFKPRFDLSPGTRLKIQIHLAEGKTLSQLLRLPKDAAQPFRIVGISPSPNQIPANTLRFYIYFSRPVDTATVYKHIQLIDLKSNRPILQPFIELPDALWSRDKKRLTLLLDPGRIKRGLKPREQVGPIFHPDGKYRLVISSNWKNDTGEPISGILKKDFTTSSEDHTPPKIQGWKLTLPTPNSRTPLKVQFDKPLDRALAERLINIQFNGKRLPLKFSSVGPNQATIKMVPTNPWAAGKYELTVAAALEDLCGNRPGRPFDFDLQSAASDSPTVKRTIPFRIENQRK